MVKPILDRVFVKPLEQKQGALIMPEDTEVKYGEIIAVGEDVKTVTVGQKVFYFKWDDLPVFDKDFVVIRERCILGVIEDDGK